MQVDDLTIGAPAFARIDCIEAPEAAPRRIRLQRQRRQSDRAGLYGAQRDLTRAVPIALVDRQRDAEMRAFAKPAAELAEAVIARVVLRIGKWAICEIR